MLVAASSATKSQASPDDRSIQGEWLVTSAEENGRPKEGDIGFKAIFTGDKLTLQRDKQDAFALKYKLDATQKPRAIDTSHEIDPGKPIIQLGAYALDGDTLRLCLAPAGRPRPPKIETKQGDGVVLFILKRARTSEK